MTIFSLDCETFPIQEDNKAPQLICLSTCTDGGKPNLYDSATAEHVLHMLFGDYDNIFVLHNAPFDMAVLMKAHPRLEGGIWKLYEQGSIRDTGTREKLIDIRRGAFQEKGGTYTLGALAKKYCNHILDKSEDGWRMRYSELAHLPVAEWPADARQYALEDAEYTLRVYKEQERLLNEDPLPPGEEIRQAKAHWALHLTSLRGLRADAKYVKELDEATDFRIKTAQIKLAEAGVYHFKKGNRELKLTKKGEPSKNMAVVKGLVTKAYTALGLEVPKTTGGGVCTDTNVKKESGDPTLLLMDSIMSDVKIQTSYLPLLKKCVDKRIQPSFGVIKYTGRSSSYEPNVQQWPRDGGVRECLVPEDGYVFVSCDYDTLELRCLAQILKWRFGHSVLMDAICGGADVHLMVAAQLSGVTYEEAQARHKKGDKEIKANRQRAKIANFGFAGGMGPATFVKHAAKQGLYITKDYAFNLRAVWLQTWPEMQRYFNVAAEHTGDFGDKFLTCWVSGRQISGVGFSDYCNYQFQGLAADGAKGALYETVKLCLTDSSSPLFGSHPYNFVHDSIELESPKEMAAGAAVELKRIMEKQMQYWVPDVPITATACLSFRASKEAQPVFDSEGRLIPWIG